MTQPQPQPNVILRCLVGSTAHGLHHPGQDDRDEMGVFIAPIEQKLGITPLIPHIIERTQPEGHRSGPGDLDLVLYELAKFMRLATDGNPTVLLLLFSQPLTLPPLSPPTPSPLGRELQALAPHIASQRCAPRYQGYVRAQHQRLQGTLGQRSVNRPELVERYGYDTKYAMHILRLAAQGTELLTQHRITLPMPEPERSRIMDVRNGLVSYDETCERIAIAEAALDEAVAGSTLPAQPDYERINEFMIHAYMSTWGRPDTTHSLSPLPPAVWWD